jgi:CRISPR system Cascade subunit CasD
MTAVLLMRLAGLMQSWGVQSRFGHRDTGLEPSKSGVAGLLAAALGRSRDADVSDLAALTMAVRVDREGRMSRDFHTAGGERREGAYLGRDDRGRPIPYGVAKADGSRPGTVVSERDYLADADFLVALAGADRAFMETLDAALRAPVWPLFLGRKSFVPGVPPAVGVFAGELLAVLSSRPWRRRSAWDAPPDRIRVVAETAFGVGPEVRPDRPVSFARREFALRHVETLYLPDPRRKLPLPPVEEEPS